MSIRIKGVIPREMSDLDVIEAAEDRGLIDPNGNPFKVITLVWNEGSVQKISHRTKTHGFEDTMLTRSTSGKLKIEYQKPGNVRWLKDRLTGMITGLLAKTPHNMETLSTCFYNNDWTIKDKDIRREVEEMAKSYDKQLDNELITHLDKEGFPILDDYNNPVVETKLAYEKRRREAAKTGRAKRGTFPAYEDTSEDSLTGQTEEQKIAFLEKLEEKRKKVKEEKMAAIRSGKFSGQYTAEGLAMMNINVMKKLAKEKFNILRAFDHGKEKIPKKDLIKMVLEKQKQQIEAA